MGGLQVTQRFFKKYRSILKKYMLTVFKISMSIVLFLLILDNLDFSGTVKLLKNVNTNFLLIALLILAVQTILASIRWKIVLDNFNLKLPHFDILRYLWIGLFFNQALPSSIGGDALRGYYLRRNGSSLRDSAIGVLLDRFFGMTGLFIMVLLVVPMLLNRLDSLTAQWSVVLFSGALFAVISVSLVLDLLPLKLEKWRLVGGLRTLSLKARKMLFSNKPGITLVLLSVIVHFFSVFAVIALSEGLSLEIEWLGIFLIIPLVTLFMLIPISIAGWGIREGVMVIGLGYLNVQSEQALALSILYGLSMLTISLPGGIVWLFSSHPSRK